MLQEERNMFIDNTSKFGTYKPSVFINIIIKITRSVGKGWFSKRLIFLLRKIAINFSLKCIDTDIFDGHARLYIEGNICEKRALFSPQIFDSDERGFIEKSAGDGSIFIDIGSNVGLYSLSLGSKYKNLHNAEIHSIEPHPGLFKRLEFNISLNKDFPIKTHNLAIMDNNKDFYLKMNDINLGETIVSNEGEVKVLGKKLETFLKDEGINKISVLKIDVEGNEEKILLPFLKDENKKLFPKTIIIEQNNDLWDGSLLKLLKEYGYNTYKKTRMNIILLKD